jgi:hypothetical protein
MLVPDSQHKKTISYSNISINGCSVYEQRQRLTAQQVSMWSLWWLLRTHHSASTVVLVRTAQLLLQ